MSTQLLGLVILTWCLGQGNPTPASLARSSQSACPTVAVECPSDIDKSVLVFKVKIAGEKLANSAMTYKWSVHGGEIREGQGTSAVSITNFDLRKKTLTVVVDVCGLPEGCAGNASCSISV
jgi:hypothetical protein